MGKQAVIDSVGLVGALFSCARMCLLPRCGVVGVGACFGLGIKHLRASEHTVGFTFNTVLASAAFVGGGCPRSRPVTVVLLVWVVCGGLFVICIVVASIFVLYCFLCFV